MKLWKSISILFILFAADPAAASKRALLIGISRYQKLPILENPTVDVDRFAPKLETLGYLVSSAKDEEASRDGLVRKFSEFINSIQEGDEIIVYYSGHGVDIKGDNMIVPYDSPSSQDVINKYSLQQSFISFRSWMAEIEDRAPSVQVWVIDACRTNPYPEKGRPFASEGGLAKIDAPDNSFVFLSAKFGQLAKDRLPTDPPNSKFGSPFSRVFVELFDNWKSKDIDDYAKEVRRKVRELVQPDPQFPSIQNEILKGWCFDTCEQNADVKWALLRIERTNDQLNRLYRPLNLMLKQGDVEWLEFTERFQTQFGRINPFLAKLAKDPDGRDVLIAIPMQEKEWGVWIEAARTLFKPHNERIADLIRSGAALVEDEDANKCFAEFMLHKAAFDAALASATSDPTIRVWNVRHAWPQCLETSVQNTVRALQARQSKLEQLSVPHR